MIEVTELNYYPIKSCAGTSVEVAEFSEQGIKLDREWMITDEAGNFMSQRKNPEMALIIPTREEGCLRVTAPGMGQLVIDLADIDQPPVDAIVWGNQAPAITQGSEADAWFGSYLGKADVKFVRKDPNGNRHTKQQYQHKGATNEVAFADGASLLLASRASLRALNSRLEEERPMNSFRPNIVIDGVDPYDEDYWRVAKIGDLTVFIAWGCARCPIIDTDQTTAIRGRDVRKALAQSRTGVDTVDPNNKGIFFGQNLAHILEQGASVRVGDRVEIVERAENRNIILTV